MHREIIADDTVIGWDTEDRRKLSPIWVKLGLPHFWKGKRRNRIKNKNSFTCLKYVLLLTIVGPLLSMTFLLHWLGTDHAS